MIVKWRGVRERGGVDTHQTYFFVPLVIKLIIQLLNFIFGEFKKNFGVQILNALRTRLN